MARLLFLFSLILKLSLSFSFKLCEVPRTHHPRDTLNSYQRDKPNQIDSTALKKILFTAASIPLFFFSIDSAYAADKYSDISFRVPNQSPGRVTCFDVLKKSFLYIKFYYLAVLGWELARQKRTIAIKELQEKGIVKVDTDDSGNQFLSLPWLPNKKLPYKSLSVSQRLSSEVFAGSCCST